MIIHMIVVILFIGPIVVPLFCWFVLKIRHSPIFKISRVIRLILALFSSILVGFELYRWKSTGMSPEFVGQIIGQITVIWLLARRWDVSAR
jgi:hypothetical protein